MALKISLTKDRRVIWPVNVLIAQDGGKSTRQTFKGGFKLLPQSEVDALLEAHPRDFDKVLLGEVLESWDGLIDADSDQAIPFNDETKAALVDLPEVRAALVEAYFSAASGGKRKN